MKILSCGIIVLCFSYFFVSGDHFTRADEATEPANSSAEGITSTVSTKDLEQDFDYISETDNEKSLQKDENLQKPTIQSNKEQNLEEATGTVNKDPQQKDENLQKLTIQINKEQNLEEASGTVNKDPQQKDENLQKQTTQSSEEQNLEELPGRVNKDPHKKDEHSQQPTTQSNEEQNIEEAPERVNKDTHKTSENLQEPKVRNDKKPILQGTPETFNKNPHLKDGNLLQPNTKNDKKENVEETLKNENSKSFQNVSLQQEYHRGPVTNVYVTPNEKVSKLTEKLTDMTIQPVQVKETDKLTDHHQTSAEVESSTSAGLTTSTNKTTMKNKEQSEPTRIQITFDKETTSKEKQIIGDDALGLTSSSVRSSGYLNINERFDRFLEHINAQIAKSKQDRIELPNIKHNIGGKLIWKIGSIKAQEGYFTKVNSLKRIGDIKLNITKNVVFLNTIISLKQATVNYKNYEIKVRKHKFDKKGFFHLSVRRNLINMIFFVKQDKRVCDAGILQLRLLELGDVVGNFFFPQEMHWLYDEMYPTFANNFMPLIRDKVFEVIYDTFALLKNETCSQLL